MQVIRPRIIIQNARREHDVYERMTKSVSITTIDVRPTTVLMVVRAIHTPSR